MKVCVMGLGEVGLPTAIYNQQKGLTVYGYDIDDSKTTLAKSKGLSNATTKWDEIPHGEIDVYVVCVPTFSVINAVANIPRDTTALITIESTVVPGTCRKIAEKYRYVAHCPHRYWKGDPKRRGVRQLRVFAASNSEAKTFGVDYYVNILDIPLHIVSSLEVAELSKLVENAWRYVSIAFSEEVRMICESKFGVSFEEVRWAVNTKYAPDWCAKLLEARDGIGGHCLPKDTAILSAFSTDHGILKAAMRIDKEYRKWLRLPEAAEL